MTAEELVKETKDSIDFNIKKLEILDKDIELIKQEAQQKINKLNQDRNQIVTQIVRDQGAVEKIEKLINTNNKVESK